MPRHLITDPHLLFWSKVNFCGPLWNGSHCWEWTAALKRGYGTIKRQGGMRPAHRVAYEYLRGPIPDGLTIDHLCRNLPCVYPWHLEPVTNKVNLARGVGPSALNARKTHCKRGHLFDEANTHRDDTGRRRCRACWRMYWLRRKLAVELVLLDD